MEQETTIRDERNICLSDLKKYIDERIDEKLAEAERKRGMKRFASCLHD